MDFFPYVMTFVALFLGWAQWISLSRQLSEAKAERDAFVESMESLYKGMFIAGCNVHRDGTPCVRPLPGEPPAYVCPPCHARILLDRYRVGKAIDKIL